MASLTRRSAWANSWQVLSSLTSRDVKGQFKRTALGRLWSLISPLAQIAIYGLVFGLLFDARPARGINSGLDTYALWLGIGIIIWGYINGGIKDAMNSYLAFSGLLKKVALPRWTLPLSKVFSRTITFFTELAVLTAVCGILGGPQILVRLVMLVPLLVLTVAFVYGLSLILGLALVYFRDIEHFWTIATQAWFYASGIMFPISIVQNKQAEFDAEGVTFLGMDVPLLAAFEANPAYVIISAYRRVLYDFAWPEPVMMATIAAWAAVMLLIGVLMYRRLQGRIVEEL